MKKKRKVLRGAQEEGVRRAEDENKKDKEKNEEKEDEEKQKEEAYRLIILH